MKNIDQTKLADTITKLDSVIKAGGKGATPQNGFILACLQELALILDSDPVPENVAEEPEEQVEPEEA